jgi:electron transfer flavoprotein beta subunit
MKIVVCVKHVPDATADRRFEPDGTVDRVGVDGLLSELDEYAIEQALQVKERLAASAGDNEVTVLTVGPEKAADAIRKALQMGADKGVHVLDEAIAGSDALATSLVLAAAIRRLDHDLVVCGLSSTDGAMGVVPAMLAERLGVPGVTLAGAVEEVEPGRIRIRRDGDAASVLVEAALPAVLSVTDQTDEPRYPSFKGIMAAKKKPVETWSLADLDISPDQVGLSASWSVVEQTAARPPRSAGEIVTDEGGNGAKALVDFLAAKRFI